MAIRFQRRSLVTAIVAIVALAALAALLWWISRDPAPTPRAAAPATANMQDAAGQPPRTAQEEIACFDRLVAAPPAEGNVQAAFERCRFVPAPDANEAAPAPANGQAAR